MKSSYKIFWTNHALNELKAVFDYLEAQWTEKEAKNLALEIERVLQIISNNPELFPNSPHKKEVRRAVVTKHNTLYYRKNKEIIEILSFFSNKKHPKNLDL